MRKVAARIVTRSVTDTTVQIGQPALKTIRNAISQL